MIKKDVYGNFIVRCDVCGNEEMYDTMDDMEVLKIMLQENGWRSKPKYKNICEDCREERRRVK